MGYQRRAKGALDGTKITVSLTAEKTDEKGIKTFPAPAGPKTATPNLLISKVAYDGKLAAAWSREGKKAVTSVSSALPLASQLPKKGKI